MTREELLSAEIKKPDGEIYRQAREKWDSIAKPIDGLGVFEDIICRTAAAQGSLLPDISKKALIIMCADNGVVAEGVSQSGQAVTYDVAALMGKRRSSVGVMAGGYPVDIFAYDVGINSDGTPDGVINRKVAKGTADFAKGSAMTEEQCMEAVNVGIEAVKECRDRGIGMIATGEMGIGNTTTASALLCALTGADPESVTGRGAGLGEEGLARKISVIRNGLEVHTDGPKASTPEEAFSALAALGGFDIAALAGVYIAGAMYGIPIVMDGLISAVAALLSERMVSGSKDYMIASHIGREKGMRLIFEELSLRPVIDADLALGEGTGALMLFPMADMAYRLYSEGTGFLATPIGQYERFT